jgi:hypothetical protein
MKRISLSVLLLSLFISLVGCSSNPEDKIVGEWSGQDHGKVFKLILTKDNEAILINNNEVIGGKDFVINGVKAQMKYEINYSKDPIWLDLIAFKKDNEKEKATMKGIIKFLTDTKIQYRVNFIANGTRFDNFDADDKTNTVVLDKVK